MEAMRFSVIIPTFNRQATLRQTLKAIEAQTTDGFEVIVIDDGSTDGTNKAVTGEFPWVQYIRQANQGPAAARNAGIRVAAGDIVAFTDDDCVPPPDWLSRLADGYARHPEVAGVGGYLEAPDNTLADSSLARYETFIARTMYHVDDNERVGGFEIPAGGTNNMSYRHSIVQAVHGFDATFRYAAGEDADLKWRVCSLGYQLLYMPIKMTHLQDYSWGRLRRQCFYRGIGRMQYEHRRGEFPGGFTLAARLTRALLELPINILKMPEPAFAIARLVESAWGVAGQWHALKMA
jgi:glycosyltransferase involved in cell wall biosynthesis